MTMGTAATMMGIAEAIGLTLPGASASRRRTPTTSAWRRLRPPHRRDGVGGPDAGEAMLTRAAFDNGIAVAMAMGCSTNAIIHLIAMARRAGHPVTLDDFDAASRKVPVIANIRPSGDTYLMEDFYYAGGLPALMKRHRAT
jgi:dihydroxyacid dehydratase/phosphogluconate dehydratase